MMVMQKSKAIFKTVIIIVATLLISGNLGLVAFADDSESTDLNVNVREVLSVSVTTPTNWASGDIDIFLRNPVSLDIVTNNANGFTASMTMKTNSTSLVNTSKNTITLPTLTGNVSRANFPANYWGYSLDDTTNGSSTSTYRAIVGANSTPITILQSSTASTGHKDFYFGARANATQAAGTYTGTVVISVVVGTINNNTNPAVPTDPDVPNPTPNTPTYNPTHGTTTYTTTTTTNGNTTTTTEVSAGDNRAAYTPPQGVSYTKTSGGLTALATGLGIVSSIATTSGMFFFILAKRREDDEEEEDKDSSEPYNW